MAVLTVYSLSAITTLKAQDEVKKEEKKKQLILPVQDKPAVLKPISAATPDPRIDLYLSRLNTRAFFPLRRNAYIRQISEVFLYSPKYRLVVTSSAVAKKMEYQLNIDITSTRGGYFIKAGILHNGKEIESKTFKSSNKRRSVLSTFRRTLYVLLIGHENYKSKKIKLDRLSYTSVSKAMRIPPPKKWVPPPPPPKKKKKKKKKKKIVEVKPPVKKKKVVTVDFDKQGNTDDKEGKVGQLDQDSDKDKDKDKSNFWAGFPRIFVKASMVIGDPVSGLMPSKQGVQTTELSLGLNKTSWGTSVGYYSRSYILQTISTVEVSQKYSEIRLHQDVIGFNLFVEGKDRVHTKDRDAFYIGVSAGMGSMTIEGERLTELNQETTTLGLYSAGLYLNILGVGLIEANYLTFSEEPVSGLRLSTQYPATVLRVGVGFPL